MKFLKSVLFVILVILTILTVISLGFIIYDYSQRSFEFSLEGFSAMMLPLKYWSGLYAANIAVFSVYYWIFQMTVSQSTLERIEKETIEKKKENTLAASDTFHNVISPSLHKLYKSIKNADEYLLSQIWNLENFTDESVAEQNPKWERTYIKENAKIFEEVLQFNGMLEGFAARVMHGSIDEELAFKLFGKPFHSLMQQLYPFVAGYRSDKGSKDYYNNIVELYKIWSKRIKK